MISSPADVAHPGIRRRSPLYFVPHGDTSRVLRRALERKGHAVTSGCSVAETLAVFPTARPDVLISDIRLPDGSGWGLLAKLSDRGPVFAIAMSGYGSEADRLRSQKAGFSAHLVKPFKICDLHHLLEDCPAALAEGGHPGPLGRL